MSGRKYDYLTFTAVFAVFIMFCAVMPRMYPDLPRSWVTEHTITIPTGATAKSAAEIIQKAGITGDASMLAREMLRLGIDRKLKPGVYTLRKGTAANVAKQLSKANPLVNKITLIPGYTWERTLALFGQGKDGSSAFETAIADDNNFYPPVRALLPEKPRFRFTYLLPETFYINPGPDAAAEFIKRSSEEWYKKVGVKVPAGMSKSWLFKRGILASVIEGEARYPDEYPVLAGIFIKRLEKNMKMQSCATVIYAWETKNIKKQKLSYKDLQIASPYNTYLHTGLPPAALCVPGEAAWLSALYPKESDYLFFFAGKDFRHIFSKTYEEHLKKQKKAGL